MKYVGYGMFFGAFLGIIIDRLMGLDIAPWILAGLIAGAILSTKK